MHLRSKRLPFFQHIVPLSQRWREEVVRLNVMRDVTLRDLISKEAAFPIAEDGWREEGLFLVDLSLNVILSEGVIGESAVAGTKCYRIFRRRGAPCPRCAALETIRDGIPHSVFFETGGRHGRKRFRIDALPVRDGENIIWGVVERVLRDVKEETAAERRKED